MSHNILELTTLSDTIYSKRIYESPSTYQVGYELVVPIEKVNEMVTKPQGSKIYILNYSHVTINGEEHPLESIEAYKINKCKCHIGKVKLLFKCELKEVTNNDGF